jgi:hypothetical protein
MQSFVYNALPGRVVVHRLFPDEFPKDVPNP